MALTLALGGCKEPKKVVEPKVPEVMIRTVKAQKMAMQQSLPGRTLAYMISEVRPQVDGIIQQRLFTEGQEVQAGQVLYQIDPRPYQARYDSAKAELARARAAVLAARPKAQRYANLVKIDAISKQDGDEALADLREKEAEVVAAEAALQSAKIDLDYTRIEAPISGNIETSAFTPGALVTAGQQQALTTIQQLDPIYVDVTQTSAQLLALRKQIASGALKAVDGKAEVRILLEDGSTYPRNGTLEFISTSVDRGTGNVTLRAVVPNPDHLLLPGTYVRAVLPVAVDDLAILVPQNAVSRNNKGEATVMVVVDGNKVDQKTIQVSEALKNQWRVSGGLKVGDKLIVAGGSEVRAGETVKVLDADALRKDDDKDDKKDQTKKTDRT